jgi:hypothetical protein
MKYNKHIFEILKENNYAGGAASVFGDLQPTATPFSGDNYAKGDSRVPKVLGKTVIRRGQPELTVFATGLNNEKGKKRKKGNKKKQK